MDVALEFQRLLDEGVVNNRAEIARRYGVSRARVTQVLNVLRLSRPALDLFFEMSSQVRASCTERRLRRTLSLSTEAEQIAALRDTQWDLQFR